MKYRILIVEDNEDTREILRVFLEYHGYEVVMAMTGEDAVAGFDTIRPDLVVLDVDLPGGMDGCDTLDRIRQTGHQTPVFMFSEHYDRFCDRIDESGPDCFFSKSKGALQLVVAITRKLGTDPSGQAT